MKKICFLLLFCGIAAVSFVSCTKSSSTSETSYDEKSYIEICGLKWATKNVGATEDNPYGNFYSYEQALKICPDGWRLPTSEELEQLSQFHSIPVSYDGMHGIWFSGSIPYKEGVDAVFLPMPGYELTGGVAGSFVVLVGYYGQYWSSTEGDNESVYNLDFSSEYVFVRYAWRVGCKTVRCVKDK